MAKRDWTINPMLAERNRLAKLLNQRLVRFERAGINYGAVQQYRQWIEEYYGTSKTGKLRFPEKRTATSAENWKIKVSLRRELDILDYFVNQPELSKAKKWKTQTVAGALKYKEEMKARFAAMGLTFPSDDIMFEFLKSESWKVLKKIYGSDLAIRLSGTRQYKKGNMLRRSSVQKMDAELNKFLKRMGEGYDVKDMSAEQVEEIFGLHSNSIVDVIRKTSDTV